MGNQTPGGMGPPAGGFPGAPGQQGNKKPGDKGGADKEKKKWQPPKPTRIGKKRKKGKGPQAAYKLPTVVPLTKCKLRLLRLERIKDLLLLEEEFLSNQQAVKPREDKEEEEKSKVDELRGSPMSVGNIEEIIDDNHAIISSVNGPEYYVNILSFVDKDMIEPGSTVLLHNKVLSVVGLLSDDVDPMVNVMKVEKAPLESYADIGGLQKQIQEVKEAVELPMTHPELYEDIGIKPPKGVIFYGPPGTGKTLLAKAVANETSATFLRVVGSELIQKYLGDGPKLVRELFRVADEHAPSIVFIDEIDAVGTKRYDSSSGGEREIQRTMLELLNQLDGFDARGEVKVIMATNRIDSLDPALIRPGRIDRKIEFPNPDVATKRMIFGIHTKRMALTDDVDLEEFIAAKDDLSGADIKAICVAAGTRVALSSGVSVPIEELSVGQVVLTHTATGMVPAAITAFFDQGVKECVELLFSDGRTLVCTDDHQLLRADGEWVEAGDFRIGGIRHVSGGGTPKKRPSAELVDGDAVTVSVDFPSSAPSADAGDTWSVRFGDFDFDVAQRRYHAMAFVRLLGYSLTDGSIAPHGAVDLYVGHQLDADRCLDDIALITGLRPVVNMVNATRRIQLPMSLGRAVVAAGTAVGDRQPIVVHIPPFLLAATCPLSIVREFLGGFFGGDGMTFNLTHGAGPKGDGEQLNGLGWCCVKDGSVAQQQQDQLRAELLPLLLRCGLSADQLIFELSRTAPCSLTAAGLAERDAIVAAGGKLSEFQPVGAVLDADRSYHVNVIFSTAASVLFAANVGFRYCCHKQVRLSAGIVFFNGVRTINRQRNVLRAAITAEEATGQHRSFKAAARVALTVAQADASVHPVNQRWTHVVPRCELNLAQRSDMVAHYSLKSVLDESGVRRFCSDPRPSPRYRPGQPLQPLHDNGQQQPQQQQQPAVQRGAVTYGVDKDARALPTFRLQVVGRRTVGRQHVYDITVANGQSFLANGIVVHNCTEAGLLALRERRMKVTQKDFRAAKETALYKKQANIPEGLFL